MSLAIGIGISTVLPLGNSTAPGADVNNLLLMTGDAFLLMSGPPDVLALLN